MTTDFLWNLVCVEPDFDDKACVGLGLAIGCTAPVAETLAEMLT
jgi:hypothetical protein